MEGPNASLVPADKTLAIARALIAYDPDDFEEAFELEIAKLEYQRTHGLGSLVDAWGCAVRADGRRWYFRVSLDGSGESQEARPDAEIVVTFRVEGKQPAQTALRANTEALTSGRLNPGRELTPLDVVRMENAIEACEAGHRGVVLRALAAVGPDGDAVLGELEEQRTVYSADGYLTGEVLATVLLRRARYPQKHAGEAVEERLESAGRAAIAGGDEQQVQTVADRLRARFAQNLGWAMESGDIEGHMSTLLTAVPQGYAATILYRVLAEASVDGVRRDRSARIHRQVQEDNARARHAFLHQVTDLGGLQWHLARTAIEAVRSVRGEKAAVAEAQRLVELRLYPSAVVSSLMGLPSA